jgi:hypothetical protein
MREELRALEKQIDLLREEYLLAKERHEFLEQYDLHQEMKKLRQQHKEMQQKLIS